MSRVYSVCPGSLGATKEKDQVSLDVCWWLRPRPVAPRRRLLLAPPLFSCVLRYTLRTHHTRKDKRRTAGAAFFLKKELKERIKKESARSPLLSHTLRDGGSRSYTRTSPLENARTITIYIQGNTFLFSYVFRMIIFFFYLKKKDRGWIWAWDLASQLRRRIFHLKILTNQHSFWNGFSCKKVLWQHNFWRGVKLLPHYARRLCEVSYTHTYSRRAWVYGQVHTYTTLKLWELPVIATFGSSATGFYSWIWGVTVVNSPQLTGQGSICEILFTSTLFIRLLNQEWSESYTLFICQITSEKLVKQKFSIIVQEKVVKNPLLTLLKVLKKIQYQSSKN